jgi:hypothetical protein
MHLPIYTFYLHKDEDAVPSFEIVHFEDEDRALAHGKRLLQERSRYRSVEITLDDQSLAKFTRDDL